MNFFDAYVSMNEGKRVKRSRWKGYCDIEDGKVILHAQYCRKVDFLNDLEKEELTRHILQNDWYIVEATENEMLTFDEALKLAKEDCVAIRRRCWDSQFIFCGLKDDIKERVLVTNNMKEWIPTEEDIMANDWTKEINKKNKIQI